MAVKFVLGTLGYVAEVVLRNGSQENNMAEDSNSFPDDEEDMDNEMSELVHNVDNVRVL